MLIEPQGTVNTGDAPGERTSPLRELGDASAAGRARGARGDHLCVDAEAYRAAGERREREHQGLPLGGRRKSLDHAPQRSRRSGRWPDPGRRRSGGETGAR